MTKEVSEAERLKEIQVEIDKLKTTLYDPYKKPKKKDKK